MNPFESDRVEASSETLMRQASTTAEEYFKQAHKVLRESELKFTAADVVALAEVAARDFHTAVSQRRAQFIEGALERIAGSLDGIASALTKNEDEE